MSKTRYIKRLLLIRYITSDHKPLSVTFAQSFLPEMVAVNQKAHGVRISWKQLSQDFNHWQYYESTTCLLSQIHLNKHLMCCWDQFCVNSEHLAATDEFYLNLT